MCIDTYAPFAESDIFNRIHKRRSEFVFLSRILSLGFLLPFAATGRETWLKPIKKIKRVDQKRVQREKKTSSS